MKAEPTPPTPGNRSTDEILNDIDREYLADEQATVKARIEAAQLDDGTRREIVARAQDFVRAIREADKDIQGIDALMAEYDLSSEEGIVLMCLAEALLRIPDGETADKLIRDKLAKGHWDEHMGHSDSTFVNASTWGLMVTGRFVQLGANTQAHPSNFLKGMVSRLGEPVLRVAMRHAMEIVGRQFVLGETIDQALKRSREAANRRYAYSYDMLGEAALTADDAKRFLESYLHSIEVIGGQKEVRDAGISVKLSALHPRYTFWQQERVERELVPRLLEIAEAAKRHDLWVAVDAEEAERLDISLRVFEKVVRDDALKGWNGLGMVVQGYQKRAMPVLDWLDSLARDIGKCIPVRLVKGAYWDTEIKLAQIQGLKDYPVFTRKVHTDVSYMACARRMFSAGGFIYPQFATHNAHTVATILSLAGGDPYEFQRLHGMGEGLYGHLLDQKPELTCRVYAPVGGHAELLPYLVRRLLENGANTSFVNRATHRETPVEEIVTDPIDDALANDCTRHPRIPLPKDLFGPDRQNSQGLNFADLNERRGLLETMEREAQASSRCCPLINGREITEDKARTVASPANYERKIGTVYWTPTEKVDEAVRHARAGFKRWRDTPVEQRAAIIEKVADLLEEHCFELTASSALEGGRIMLDGEAEVREAVDFCRYYAWQARETFPRRVLPGPSGEDNTYQMLGRGVFVCISPWNFPVAIFTGQVVAALVAGNAVLAKPAEQTSLTAARIVRLMHQAGVPKDVLHLLPGDGSVGGALVGHPDIDGVAFTGSVETSRLIQKALTDKPGPIVPLIAETGGQNAMLVDSSALPEQVVQDVIRSAFDSAGQRCSALRVLYLQEDIAPRVLEMLSGAMAELVLGDPLDLSTDIGPVIDLDAKHNLERHVDFLRNNAKLIYRCLLPNGLSSDLFFPPQVWEIESIHQLEREVFGPILHVVRYKASELDDVIDAVNATGYGLTLGIHSRIEDTASYIKERVDIGNVYINRDIVGAVVGVQPFGGQGLSGTGPKAGGPNYLPRFAVEKAISDNVAAVGGNATLLSLND
ncbi:MAG TPA: bifunctional proline dehydrogenase/L-glutamate gamma-semialdehyde dehydrogenase PutA [Arenicellales bacterium]|nr:bifunctional proline dehydrogenase/L-glutamate gamma-semialdehyde dehydrogenase PutA [Arenicellales bacterium]